MSCSLLSIAHLLILVCIWQNLRAKVHIVISFSVLSVCQQSKHIMLFVKFLGVVRFDSHYVAALENTTPQPFYGPFSGTTQVSQWQKIASSGLYSAREDNKRQTHWQSGWAPFHPDQSAIHLHQSPHFHAGFRSCHNLPHLSWLGTGTGICWIAYSHGLVLHTSLALENSYR